MLIIQEKQEKCTDLPETVLCVNLRTAVLKLCSIVLDATFHYVMTVINLTEKKLRKVGVLNVGIIGYVLIQDPETWKLITILRHSKNSNLT